MLHSLHTLSKAVTCFNSCGVRLRDLHVPGWTFRVFFATCDGASCNRKMFSMHGTKDEFVYKTINVFSKDPQDVYFFSDPLHLVKTIRNCLASKNRNLWVSNHSFYCVIMYTYIHV